MNVLIMMFINVYSFLNQFYKRLNEVLDEEIEYIKANHQEIDCYMLAVLSYGTQHEITMVDGKNVNPEMIVQRFSGEQLPELAEKPKIFIIHTDHGRYQLAYLNYVTIRVKRGVYLIAGAPSMTCGNLCLKASPNGLIIHQCAPKAMSVLKKLVEHDSPPPPNKSHNMASALAFLPSYLFI